MKKKHYINGKKSIFKALFVPLFFIMIAQACVFYYVAVYGGIEESLMQNETDILKERLVNRKNEIETLYDKSWTDLSESEKRISDVYKKYCNIYGNRPLISEKKIQGSFLKDVSDILLNTLRMNEVNGIYIILNDKDKKSGFDEKNGEQKMGICIRDLDQTSNYTGSEDLLIERAPASIIKDIGCPLDSWWAAKYSFDSEKDGDFYYNPLNAAWDNPDADGEDIAYFAESHQISKLDIPVVSYSIPLMDLYGYPYAVLGVELTTNYLASLMPNRELLSSDSGCYMLAMFDKNSNKCKPVVGKGNIYKKYFNNVSEISVNDYSGKGGFYIKGNDGTKLFGSIADIKLYNNNNPFEDKQLVLMAVVEAEALFSYIIQIKQMLAGVSLISLALGLLSIVLVSRNFARPITQLAERVKTTKPQDGFTLRRLGIYEIDQLVDSIEELNRTASRDTARTEFFSRMSHDMRTPMNAIISFSSPELLEGTSDEQKEEYMGKIHSSGLYLLGLINEVLDMTKIESNKIDIVCSPQKSVQIWDTVITIIDKLAQKKNVKFVKDIDVKDYIVMVDEQHLNQVVMNLLSNAVKFTRQNGTVCFKVVMDREKENPEYVNCNIVVADDGIGMSKEFMKKLYTPFVQENDGKEGTGLGLSIAKKLIEMMGGTIVCTSEKGVGTTFTLDLSLQICSDDNYTVDDASMVMQDEITDNKNDKKVSLDKKHLLVCEDHPLNTQIIVRLLNKAGITVDTAENGKLGLEKFKDSKEGTYDAVLMDIRMPVMDGLETAKAIRSLNRTDAKKIPIIAMTANAFDEDVKASKAAGMNAHLSKPVDPQKVYETLEKFLE